jgi:phosphoribosyl 1,2-cyclic phosphate phosphodiesterase
MMGLDDVRPFQFKRKDPIPVFGSEATLAALQRCFQYAFDGQERSTYVPKLALHSLNGAAFEVCGLEITPIPILHGPDTIYGFRFGAAAYLTDHSEIPAESLEKLRGLDVLFLDALRHKPHPTHSTVERSTRTVEQLAPKRAFFTHICHDLPHERTESQLPPHIRLAYDGLEIRVPEA